MEHFCKVCEQVVRLDAKQYIGSMGDENGKVFLFDCPTPGCKNTLAIELTN